MKRCFNSIALGAVTLGGLLCLAGGQAFADYPEKPIKLYVGFATGGGTDTIARGLASYIHEIEGMNEMPMVVINKPGGSGMQAAKLVKEASPDGYVFHIINSGTFAAANVGKANALVDPLEDFAPMGCLSQVVTSLFIHASSSYKDAASWVKAMKEKGGTIRWATSGSGTMHALIGHLMMTTWGLDNQVVPFKGAPLVRAALVAQKVDAAFNAVHSGKGFESEVRALGVPLKERDPANPEVPTFGEQGLPVFDVSGLQCVWGPKGIPDDVAGKVRNAIKQVAALPGFKKFLEKADLEAFYTSPDASYQSLKGLLDAFRPIAARLGQEK